MFRYNQNKRKFADSRNSMADHDTTPGYQSQTYTAIAPTAPEAYYQASTQSTVIYVPAQLGPNPSTVVCAGCNRHVTTRLEYESSTITHIFAFLFCLIFFPFFCIPYCVDSYKKVNHYCPECSAFLGTFKYTTEEQPCDSSIQ